MSAVDKDFTTLMSETKSVNARGPMQHELHFWKAWPHILRWKIQNQEAEKELYAQREAMMLALRRVFQQRQLEKSFERWVDSSEDEGAPDVPDTAYPQVATMKHDEVHRLFPSKAEAVSLEEADSDADRHQSEADQALEKDGLVIPFPHEKHHLFAMEVLNTFPKTDVVLIFSVASGEIVKAVILKHKYAVCFVPTLRAKEFAYARLLDWLKHSNVLPPRPPIPKPEEVLMWERDHAQGQPNVPKPSPPAQPIVPKNPSPPPSAPSATLPTPSADTLVLKADAAKNAVVTPKLPGIVVPKIAQFGSSVL